MKNTPGIFLVLSDGIFHRFKVFRLAVRVLVLVLVLVFVQSEGPRVPHCSVELVGIFQRSVVMVFVICLTERGL